MRQTRQYRQSRRARRSRQYRRGGAPVGMPAKQGFANNAFTLGGANMLNMFRGGVGDGEVLPPEVPPEVKEYRRGGRRQSRRTRRQLRR